jgi:antitoxin component YwqK of YwqJK toxin-antitoxin module
MNKNIRPFNDKDQQHGYWERYYFGQTLWYKCFYHNGKQVGYEELYSNGKLTIKRYYI